MHNETIIFGIGKCGKEYVKRCVECNVDSIRIIDSNKELWGKEFLGISIEEPKKVLADNVELVVVAVSDKYQQEIFQQLTEEYKVLPESIKYYKETIVLSKEERYNMGNMLFEKKLTAGVILTGAELCSLLKMDSLNSLEYFFFHENHNLLDKWLHYFEAYERFFSKPPCPHTWHHHK